MNSPPLCQPPDFNIKAPAFQLPDNACDCHYHIFDEPSPQVLPRTYTAPTSTRLDIQNVHNTLGITRSVVVQPSIYGTDNRTTLSAVTSPSTKAIVVVDDNVSLETLKQLKDLGAVGCRVNLLFQSNAQINNLKALARKIAEVDWQLQLLVDISTFDDLESLVKSLDVPVVFDHMGHFPIQKSINHSSFQQLLRLLGDGHAWVKLSGAYRLSDGKHPNYSDVNVIADALVNCNPERLVWGSDWPHPHMQDKMPNDTELLNLLAHWVPNKTMRDTILADNPAKLYAF